MAKDSKKPKVETRRGLTPTGMASFPNLFTAKKINESDDSEEPKFRLTHVYMVADFKDPDLTAFNMMVDNVNTVCRLELHKTFDEDMVSAFEAALVEHVDTPLKAHYAAFKCLTWLDKANQVMRSCRSPFLLGKNDDYVDDKSIFIRLSSKADRQPEVVNQSKEPITESEIYGGVLVRASYVAYPYNNLGNQGVTLYMGNVQKCGKGTRLGGGPSAKDEFDDVAAEDSSEDTPF